MGAVELSQREQAVVRSLRHGFFDPARLDNNSILSGITDSLPYVRGCFLDLGCGAMPYAGLVRDRVSHYISTDLRPNTATPPTVVSDSLRLPFRHNTFDTVLCTQVLEHVRNPFSTLAEIARVLRPGGHAILTLPAVWPLHEEPNDFFRYTKYGLRELAESAHLHPVTIVERGGGIMAIAQLIGVILDDTFSGHILTRLPMKAVIAPFLFLSAAMDRLLFYPKFTLGYTMVVMKPAE